MSEERDQAGERRTGRGRLSTIDMLPDEAEPDVLWALEQLRERAMPANMILVEFNRRLVARGIAGVSKSAWSRFSVRKAIQFRKLDEVQRISGELVATLGIDGPDQVTVAVAEMLKVAAFQLLEGGNPGTKGLMELSRALASAVAAQRGSAEYRRQLEHRVSAQIARAADRAETIARDAGLSADAVAKLRRDFLGIRPKVSEMPGDIE